MFDYNSREQIQRLSYTVNCLVRDFCCRVKRCIGISATGDPSLVLNQQGEWVSGGGSSVRNGLSVDEGYTELGGEILKDTAVSFEGGTDQPAGLFFLPSGAVAPVDNRAMFLGQYFDLNDLSRTNGITVLYDSVTGIEACNIGNDKAIIEIVKLPNGKGQIDLEATSSDGTVVGALVIRPDIITYGLYGDKIFLNIDTVESKYAIGDLDSYLNGTFISINDLTQLIKITNVPAYADDASAITGGLVTGELYKTTTAGITALNIVP